MEDYYFFISLFYFKFFGFILIEGMKDYFFLFPFYFKFFGFILIEGMKDYFLFFISLFILNFLDLF